MEPFKPEQLAYLRKLVCEVSSYSEAKPVLLLTENLINSLPKYFCQNQIWYRRVRTHQTGIEFSGMVCIKYNAVCNVAVENAASCCDYLPFEQIGECEGGVCKM